MQLVLCRHGEAEQNIGGWYNSNPEHPNYREANLTDKGIRQAIELGQSLQQLGLNSNNVVAVFASPLPRTVQTASLVMNELGIAPELLQQHSGLIEAQAGDRESQIIASFNEGDGWFPEQPERFRGESRHDIKQRMTGAYEFIKDYCRSKHADESGHMLLFSHGSPLYLLLEAITGSGVRLPTAGFRKLSSCFSLDRV